MPKEGTKKFIIEILLVLIIAAGSGYGGYTVGQSPLKGYINEVDGLKIEMLDVQNQIGQIEEDYTSLQGDYTELQEDYAILQEQLSDTNEALTSTKSSFQDLITEYEILNENYEIIEQIKDEEIENLKMQLETLNDTYQNFVLVYSSKFVISDLIINPEEVESNQPVKISVTVKNIGGLEDSYILQLKIDDILEASKEVTLIGDESTTTSFDVIKNEASTYNFTLNDLSGTFNVIRPLWCEIGVPYESANGITVTLTSLTITEKVGSYQYRILYTLKNGQTNRSIYEGAFKLHGELDVADQYGFFGELFPGDSWSRSYTFEELKDKTFDMLVYIQFIDWIPLEESLKWKVELP